MATQILRANYATGLSHNAWMKQGAAASCVDAVDPVSHDEDSSYMRTIDTNAHQDMKSTSWPDDVGAVTSIAIAYRERGETVASHSSNMSIENSTTRVTKNQTESGQTYGSRN